MYALFQLIWCTHVHSGFTLKNKDVQWFILHRQVSVMLFKATVGVVERFCMIMLFGVLPLYVLCHVLTCIGQETINYLILSYLHRFNFPTNSVSCIVIHLISVEASWIQMVFKE